MPNNMRDDTAIPEELPIDTDNHYETIAGQEELHLEKTEEKLREKPISESPSAYAQHQTICVDCCFVSGSSTNELDHAAEDLITGDSDDPPLSEETVGEMIRMASNTRRFAA